MKRLFSILVCCICSTLLAHAQQPAAPVKRKQVFQYSPSVLTSGEKVNITYDPSINGIKPTVPVKASVYIFKNFAWQGYDLPLVKTDTGYTSAYLLPAGTAMVAYRFAIGDSIDRGSRFPYSMVVYGPGKKMNPGGYVEWGLFRSKDSQGQMSPIVAKESLIEPKVLVQLWISREFENPVVKRNLFFEMASGIKAYFPTAKADSILLKAGTDIIALPDVTEKEMLSVQKVYSSILRKQTLADSLTPLILAKYPDGLLHRLQLIRGIYGESDKDKKVALWDGFVKKYPFATFPYADYVNPALGDRSFFMNSYVGVSNLNFQKHDLIKVAKFSAEAPFGMLNYFYDHYVDYPFRLQVSPITDKEALVLSQYISDALLKRINAADLIDRGILAPTEWIKQEMNANAYVFVHHAGLLYKSGQFDAALKIMNTFKPYVGYKFIDFNTIYVKLLNHSGKTAEATAYTTAAIKADTASPEMIELFKAAYIKTHGSDKGYDTYYETLRPGNKLKQMQERLKASMVKIPAINFNLQNIPGQQVDLAAQKGKIVVLDFWASWCFPCKQAMPGMQILVNKYQPAGDVAFFFIATMEESPNYKKLINDFLAAKKYNFNVLYDDEDPKTKKMGLTFNDYAKLLKLSGIPQKVIIDQNGFVRWVAGGFGGDLVELTDEVSYVVDLLKKEKS